MAWGKVVLVAYAAKRMKMLSMYFAIVQLLRMCGRLLFLTSNKTCFFNLSTIGFLLIYVLLRVYKIVVLIGRVFLGCSYGEYGKIGTSSSFRTSH